MALTLVAKYSRALTESINSIYRVLKGTDPDSIDLRLNGGGRFAVHHSGTNAVVFQVTDAGATGTYQPGDITGDDIAAGAIDSSKIADGAIQNVDVAANADIAVSKLAHVGAGNVLRSNGTQNVAGQVDSGDIANGAIQDVDVAANAAIAVSKLAHVGAGNVLRSTGTQNVGGPLVASDIPNGSITSAKIVDNEIVDGDINTNAAIAVTKLAHVGAGNVLRSNGTANAAGKVVSGDIADDTIVNADINTAAAIVVSKLAAGGTANRVVATANGTTMAMQQVATDMIADGAITAPKLNSSLTTPGTGLIATTVVASLQPTITFPSIVQTYRHLELRIFGRSDAAALSADPVTLRFNLDITGVYHGEILQGNAASATASEHPTGSTSALIGYVPGAAAVAGSFGVITVSIPGYSSTVGFKRLTSTSHHAANNTTGLAVVNVLGMTWWGGVVGVTNIQLGLGTGQWMPGTIASLYGWN